MLKLAQSSDKELRFALRFHMNDFRHLNKQGDSRREQLINEITAELERRDRIQYPA